MIENNRAFSVTIHLVMILLSGFCLLPIVLLIVSSVTPESLLIKNGYTFIPTRIDFTAYAYLLRSSGSVLNGYKISLLVTVSGTLVNLALTTLLAYPLSQKDLPGRNILSFFVFFTLLFSGGLVPTYIMWTQIFHIKNTLLALVVPGLLLNPFNVIMVRTYFTNSLPAEVLESARIEGARELKILTSIVVPMSTPVIATIALLVGLGYWNDWLNGLYYINNENLFSIQVLLNRMLMDVQFLQSSANTGLTSKMIVNLPSTALKMAVAVLGILPELIAFPFFQRYFVKGITIGAVKG